MLPSPKPNHLHNKISHNYILKYAVPKIWYLSTTLNAIVPYQGPVSRSCLLTLRVDERVHRATRSIIKGRSFEMSNGHIYNRGNFAEQAATKLLPLAFYFFLLPNTSLKPLRRMCVRGSLHFPLSVTSGLLPPRRVLC